MFSYTPRNPHRLSVAGLWCFLLSSTTVFVSPCLGNDEFREIFNGNDLSGWKGHSDLWSVQDGAITGITTAESPIGANTFLIWDDGTVSDFVLELEYRILAGDEKNPGGNSGIQYRSRVLDEERFIVGGYQADIDFDLTYTGINYEERGRGILAQRGQRTTIALDGTKTVETFADATELGKKIQKKDWNQYRVEAQGSRLSHFINDQLMSETIDNQSEKASSDGVLAFQIHTGPPMIVQFRNIRIKVTQ
jgi:hypothetical protein